MQISTIKPVVSSALLAAFSLPCTAAMVQTIENTTVYVARSLPATPVADLVKYSPADADDALFDLKPLTGTAIPSGYVIEGNTIAVLEGANDAIFRVTLRSDPSVKGMLAFSVNPNPVTEVRLDGLEGEEIELTCNDILALRTAVTPDNSANKNVVITLSDMSQTDMATTYTVGGSEKFAELVTYKPGTLTLTLSALENPEIKKEYHVTVLTPETYTGGYADGTFWLNEDWFTHKNGSINYLRTPVPTDDSEIVYRAFGRANDDASFGATSQFGMIFADKLFVMSKQEHDKGDLRGKAGGRLVVADARTLERLASFEEIGGDGRACVGVSAGKAYVGTNAGIRVLTWEGNDFTLSSTDIPGISNDSENGGEIGSNPALYNKQVGDMVLSGDYLFAIQQATGIQVIDTRTDRVERLIADSGVQGIAVTADGHVWVASSLEAQTGCTTLREIDPVTLNTVRTVQVPGNISCSWGSWRSTNFFSSRGEENLLFWNAGASSITGSACTIYKWNTQSEPSQLEPLFSLGKKEGLFPDVYQMAYASMRYDERANCVLLATTTEPSGNYRYNWLKFIDADSGELLSDIRLKDYYWFPALPIFPDKEAPEFSDIQPVELCGKDTPAVIDLNGIATDADNHDFAIRVEALPSDDLRQIADISEEDGIVTIKPLKTGQSELALRAESNGRETYAYVPVTVSLNSGVSEIHGETATISVSGNRINFTGCAGLSFAVFDLSGAKMSQFMIPDNDRTVALQLPSGTYILSGIDNDRKLKFTL